jgi:hypothetical protein
VGPGSFQWSGVTFLSTQGGLGRDVPAFYVGQNGGGLHDAYLMPAKFLAPIPHLPDANDPDDSPGPGWQKMKGRNWWNPEKQQSLHPDRPHPPYGSHWDWHQRGQPKIRLRQLDNLIEFWDPEILDWLPAELLPLELIP